MNNLVIEKSIDQVFAFEVKQGLRAHSKHLPTRYIYDKKGDELFQQIMDLPEYYLTRSEFDIFKNYGKEIAESFAKKGSFQLVELGAGDCTKTKILIDELLKQEVQFTFSPIDISKNTINNLKIDLGQTFPSLKLKPLCSDYFEALKELQKSKEPKVVLFLGSNLGNFKKEEIRNFIKKLSDSLNAGDMLFLGVDMMKDPITILNAYNDSKAVTADFNKNLLRRINRELEADFDLANFYFYPVYNPIEGGVKSYLISSKAQNVTIKALDESFTFEEGEAIYTEISQKFSEPFLNELACIGSFSPLKYWTDQKAYFKNHLWIKI